MGAFLKLIVVGDLAGLLLGAADDRGRERLALLVDFPALGLLLRFQLGEERVVFLPGGFRFRGGPLFCRLNCLRGGLPGRGNLVLVFAGNLLLQPRPLLRFAPQNFHLLT